MSSIRVVYMGTPDFAVEPLKAILDAGIEVVGVVTVPDKPAGRGQKIQHSPVKAYALSRGLKLLQPEKLRDESFVTELRTLTPDIAVVVAFRMLPEVVWGIPRLGTFNLHASLLPQYRGAAPINWAIINGETVTGITTFLIDQKIDTGRILFQERIPIDPDETAGELHDKLMASGANLVVETIRALASGEITAIPQETMLTGTAVLKPAPKLYRETCRICWGEPSTKIHNLIRGLSPYPGAWTEMSMSNGDVIQVKILRSRLSEVGVNQPAGDVYVSPKKSITVACGNGSIEIALLQAAGKKAMPPEEYLRGLHNVHIVRMV
jgi:methionyl-tRNA formyltransferase